MSESTVIALNITTNDGLSESDIENARIVSGIISALSMSGALLIIISYIFFKDMRTKGREILCQMSVADFGVACANFIGTVVYFDQFIERCDVDHSIMQYHLTCGTFRQLCKAQAFFDMYCTLSSFLWTMILAFYVYVLLVDNGRKAASRFVYIGYATSWGLSAIISLWLVLTERLGSTRVGGGGWCTLRMGKGDINAYVVFFADNLWLLMTFFMILVLYVTTHIYIRLKVHHIFIRHEIQVDDIFLGSLMSSYFVYTWVHTTCAIVVIGILVH